MGCNCGKPKCDGHCGASPAVLQINNPSDCTLFHRVEVPASLGDSKTNPPKNGEYKNVLLYYEADQTSWLYSSDGIPTRLTNGLTNYEDVINLPQINGVTLIGDKNSADLKLADAPMVITVANGNTSWSGADTAEDIYNFFLNQGKVNIVFGDSENYGYEIVSAAYIPEEQKMMCTLAVAAITAGETTEFDGNALFGIMTLYTADKAIDVSQIELQPKLYVTDFTGLGLNYNELSGLPATTYSIGMVKPGDGLSISSDGTLTVIDHVFDTVADMKAATDLVDGGYARTLGYYSKDDGGGAEYQITSTSIASELFTQNLDNGNYATLVNKNAFNLLQVGCKRNVDFDNSSILSLIFKGGLNHTTVYVPEGTYQTTRINYTGDNAITEGFRLIGIGKPTIMLIHPNKVKTTNGTYTGSYTISEGLDELDLTGYATVVSITLEDYRTFYYIAVSDATKIPSSLTEGMVLRGKDSYTEAVISNIDTSDPDGAGTARIYLYETSNNHYRFLNFNVSGSNLNERLIVKQDLGDGALYLSFADNIVPSYMTVNRQVVQATSGASARIAVNNISYNSTSFVKLDNLPQDMFTKETYFQATGNLTVNSYTGYTAGMLSFNKYSDVLVDGIIFDGGNKEVDVYESNANNWNTIITGDCKNVTIQNCEFNNSIMAGVQITYMGNAFQSLFHRCAEDVRVMNCNFYNNGRGDIEIISGKNISVESCYGNGTLDIEANNNELLNNINISDVQFKWLTPYSPGASSSSVNINVSNSKFFIVLAQQGITLNLDSVMAYDLQPFKCHINANNCIFDNIGHSGYHGDEFAYMTNCSIYGLFQALPANNQGIGEYHIDNSTIDLSLWHEGTQVLTTLANFAVTNSKIVSITTRKRIRNNNAIMNLDNVVIKNVFFNGAAANAKQTPRGTLVNCKLLSVDNTVANNNDEYVFSGNVPAMDLIGCYIESNIKCLYTSVNVFDSILNTTTKPSIRAGWNCYCNGIKTNDGTGINWNWLETSSNNYTVGFSNVEFNPSFSSSTLGVKAGSVAPSVTSIAMGSRGYYVGDSDLALCRLYNNSGAVAIKQISFA